MESSSPLVSIIMPAYNAERYIGEAIDSIINQTYKNWELLICDDASTDKTAKIIDIYVRKDSRITFFKNQYNLKLLKTRNFLLQHVKGSLITFQDADDYSCKTRIEKMVLEFGKNLDLGLLSTQVSYVDEAGNQLRVSHKPTTYFEVRKKMYTHNVVGGSIMMLRRTMLDLVGGAFRSYFDGLSYQDYDLSLLMAERFEAYSLPDVLYYYRQHPTSASKIVNIDRILAKEVVIHLAEQRRDRGYDDLMAGNSNQVDAFFEDLRIPYKEDPSLIYREYAGVFMYSSLYWKAIVTSWNAALQEPYKFVNWRTLQYCIRKSLTKKILKIGI